MPRQKTKEYANVGFKFDKSLWEAFKQLAEDHRLTYTAALEWAMEDFLKKIDSSVDIGQSAERKNS